MGVQERGERVLQQDRGRSSPTEGQPAVAVAAVVAAGDEGTGLISKGR